MLGQDISYARGHFQIWAEAFEARFEVPRLGDADVFAYYSRRNTRSRRNSSRLCAGTSNSSSRITIRPASPSPPRDDVSRVDIALGYRFTAHAQLKLQYSFARGDFVSDNLQGTFAAQFTLRF